MSTKMMSFLSIGSVIRHESNGVQSVSSHAVGEPGDEQE